MISPATILTLGQAIAYNVSEADSPAASRAALSSVVSVTLALLPDELWERMVEESNTPCGRPMCDCHELTGRLFKILDPIRVEALQTRRNAELGVEP